MPRLWRNKCRSTAGLTHVSLIAGWERMVCDKNEKPVLRMFAFWKWLSVWERGALRFSDHRGMEQQNLVLENDGLSGTLTRTKTTGADKKVKNRPFAVHSGC